MAPATKAIDIPTPNLPLLKQNVVTSDGYSDSSSSDDDSAGSEGSGSPGFVLYQTTTNDLKQKLLFHPYKKTSTDSSPDEFQKLSAGVESLDLLMKTEPLDVSDSTITDKIDFDDSDLLKGINVIEKYSKHTTNILSVEGFKTFECYSHAKRLSNVAIVMCKTLQLGSFLTVFGHSISCRRENCSSTCRMIRRVRCHVIAAKHSCALMHIYGQLLRLHVDTCLKDNGACGMQSCKAMRDMREAQNNSVLPKNYRIFEKMIAAALGKNNPNTLKEAGIISEKIVLHSPQAESALDLSMSQNSKINEDKSSVVVSDNGSDEALAIVSSA